MVGSWFWHGGILSLGGVGEYILKPNFTFSRGGANYHTRDGNRFRRLLAIPVLFLYFM